MTSPHTPVMPISPEMRIVTGPTESLRASAATYRDHGDEFSANLCTRMARDCAALGPMGDALYRFWAGEQIERIARLYTAAPLSGQTR